MTGMSAARMASTAPEHAPSPLDLHRRAAGLRQESPGAGDRLGRRSAWYERKGMSPTTSARFAAPETARRVAHHRVHRRRERVLPAIDGHLDRVADKQDVDPASSSSAADGAS